MHADKNSELNFTLSGSTLSLIENGYFEKILNFVNLICYLQISCKSDNFFTKTKLSCVDYFILKSNEKE